MSAINPLESRSEVVVQMHERSEALEAELATLRARVAALEAEREAFAREVAEAAWKMDMDFVSDSGVITRAIAAVKAARGET